MHLFLLFVCVGIHTIAAQISGSDTSVPCYDRNNQAQRCQPPFVNAAYGKVVRASNTCGINQPTEYCLQTGATGARKYCYTCNDRDEANRHPAAYLTDFNNNYNNKTWWQSETMKEDMQYPESVNLTLNFKKSFDITYVNLRFYSPRPESFAIYKRTSEDGEWIPYQYYSASCELTYDLGRKGIITRDNEDQAICTNEFSDISPLTGGSVAFSTLEGRPSMFEFNRSPKLQEWVTATDIKIVLTRMNTFGDEVFGDPQVLRSYFYAISDLAVGARCKCNGHARECRPERQQDMTERLECVCEHNTMGQDCDQCLPFYNNLPWGRATEDNAHECQACNCNGLSDTCEFDPELYRTTGNGGRCTGCRDNTAGVNCEICEVNHYRGRDDRCLNCGCNAQGSTSLQCDGDGQCPCKPGVGGMRCDRCLPDFYDFSDAGCRPCACVAAGSLNNEPRCDSNTGKCECKENVDGRQCDKCKPDYFGLSEDDPFGCISCFCYGHSSECEAAMGYYQANISSNFETGNDRWTAGTRSSGEVDTQYNGIVKNLGVSSESNEAVYFEAPRRYHGDQRFSYNQFLSFNLRIGEDTGRPSVMDIVIEGSGKSISTHIFAQNNRMPGVTDQTFNFRIHENTQYQWSPRLNAVDFIGVLSNITAIKIRATYNDKGVGFIDNIHLGTARQGNQGDGEEATNVEQCVCSDGHLGQFCESCEPGYKREIQYGGPFSRCVQCQCNNHSQSCDVESGKCICQDNTEGDNCERCARGYYGDARNGQPDDCQPCPCPNGGPCFQMPNGGDVICTECEEGYGGNLCDICLDGYYGDPNQVSPLPGIPASCQKCTCNGNIDSNAVGNCNTTTGECLKCIRNTGGFYCEECLPDYYNNTLGQCTHCNCHHHGTVLKPGERSCDIKTGQCLCKDNVVGRQCEEAAPGYYNIKGSDGGAACGCDPTGSLNYTCRESDGQCYCKPGVGGRACDVCMELHFGFSDFGCTACNCDPIGSVFLECDEVSGQCFCKDGVAGLKCDQCEENKYDMAAGCLDCPQCYNLVQDAVNTHRGKLRELSAFIDQTEQNPSLFNDTTFVNKLSDVQGEVDELLRNARGAETGDGTVGQQLDALRQSLKDVMEKCAVIAKNIMAAQDATDGSKMDVEAAEEAIRRAEHALTVAGNYIERDGQQALKEALQALENFGQNNQDMTRLAKEATAEADRQKKEAEMIEDLANKALATSEEAKSLAQESLRVPAENERELARLNNEYDDANGMYEMTKMAANRTQQMAKKVRDEALDLLQKAKEDLPEVDIAGLKAQADTIKDQAANIKEQAAALMEKNQELMDKVKNQTNEANDLLDEGGQYNQRLAGLLAEADAIRSEARDALKGANDTLKEAEDTLDTINKFQNLTAQKQEAEEAMQQVGQIQDTIDEARRVTGEARAALGDVEADANKANQIARQAMEKATAASTEASNIQKEANETKAKADEAKDQAMKLKDDVDLVSSAVDDYSNTVDEDEKNANEVQQKAAKAKQDAEKTLKEVEDLTALIMAVQEKLDNLDSIDGGDEDALDKLEKKLEMVEKQLNETNLDDRLQQLETASDGIRESVRDMTVELEDLTLDVANIGDIQASLPDQCFKTIPVEAVEN